jgi:hypothetical protein
VRQFYGTCSRSSGHQAPDLSLRRSTRCHLLGSRLSAHSTRGKTKNFCEPCGLACFVQAKTLTRSASHAIPVPFASCPRPWSSTRRELNAGLTSSSAHPDPAMGKTPDRLRIPNLGNWGDSSATMKRLIRENLQSQKANLSPPPVIPGFVTG